MDDLEQQIERAEASAESAREKVRGLRVKRSQAIIADRRVKRLKKPRCLGYSIRHFKASEHEWICSACSKVGVWTDNWCYYGAISCRKCQSEPCIEFVVCSETCQNKMSGEL